MARYPTFDSAIEQSMKWLMNYGEEVDPGRWQGVATEGRPDLVTRELLNLQIEVPVARTVDKYGDHYAPLGELNKLRDEIQPNLPWADDHFAERVSRVPSNPGEEYKNWPWWRGQDEAFAQEGREQNEPNIFTHTYQERFWPKQANRKFADPWRYTEPARGIRYHYGDLDDVVNLLIKDPYTRQATFPIFFPEDTGAVHGGRVPCTLHYHFMLRKDKLHMWYPIRSCDAHRHFRDDLYMACRLMLWVIEECKQRSVFQSEEGTSGYSEPWGSAQPGTLHFTAYSFHIHKGDMHSVKA